MFTQEKKRLYIIKSDFFLARVKGKPFSALTKGEKRDIISARIKI